MISMYLFSFFFLYHFVANCLNAWVDYTHLTGKKKEKKCLFLFKKKKKKKEGK